MCRRNVLIVLQWGLFSLFGVCWTYPFCVLGFQYLPYEMLDKAFSWLHWAAWGRKLKFEWDPHPMYFDSFQDFDSNSEFLLTLLLLLGGSVGDNSLQQSSEVSLESLNSKTLVAFPFTRARGKGRRDVEEILLQRWSGTAEMKKVFLSSSVMQVTIIYSLKMPLFCECMPRKLNDGQKNSVA